MRHIIVILLVLTLVGCYSPGSTDEKEINSLVERYEEAINAAALCEATACFGKLSEKELQYMKTLMIASDIYEIDMDFQLRGVVINNNAAVGNIVMIVGGNITETQWEFIKEDNKWYIK